MGVPDRPSDTLMRLDLHFLPLVRVQRQFCAILALLLLQHGDNLRQFLALVDENLENVNLPPFAGSYGSLVDHAQVYPESAYLRDRWDGFNQVRDPNSQKRAFVLDLMERVPASPV